MYNDGTAVLSDVVIRGNQARFGQRPVQYPQGHPDLAAVAGRVARMTSHLPHVRGDDLMDRDGLRHQRRRGSGAGGRRGLWLRPTVMALEGRALLSTLTVSNTDDSGAGSLRAAVAQADADGGGDTIVFSSMFNSPQTITLTGGQLELSGTKAGTTITGPGANLLSVSGDKASRVFQIDGGVTASISGLTITGGSGGNDSGGGLENKGTLSLTDCTVSGNSAGSGGGGMANYGTATLANCTVSGNSTSRPYLFGGGLWNTGTATLTDCTVSGNSAENGSGGGLENLNSAAPATAAMTLINCTVSGNSAKQGGGVDNLQGTVTLTNCTVSGNSGTPYGVGGLNNNGGTAALTNTIVAGNSNGDISGSYSGSNNLIGGNPLLSPLGDYGGPTPTMALLPGSPAIGKGIRADYPGTTTPITTDQRGLELDSPTPDIGAFQTNPLVVNTTIDGTGSPSGDLSLRQAVNLANALGGAEAITFDPTVFATQQTITLDGTQLELKSGMVTITGPGANLLSVSGNNASRVFQVDTNVTASISGLTITGGNGGNVGGGLVNKGTLNLTACTVGGNAAGGPGGGNGGGLYNNVVARPR